MTANKKEKQPLPPPAAASVKAVIERAGEIMVRLPQVADRVSMVWPESVLVVEQQGSRTEGLVRVQQGGVAHGCKFVGIDIHDVVQRIEEAERRRLLFHSAEQTKGEHLALVITGLYELLFPAVLADVLDHVEATMPARIRSEMEKMVADRAGTGAEVGGNG